ncbi:MAG: dTMP kinase, partial [Neisseriaceae bacterium]
MSERGKFISLEGIDGVGKSTHMTFIADYLRGCGKKVVTTREPGGTEFGEKFRDLLLHSRGMHRITELLLLFASRQELIHNLVLPNLEKGVWIVSDRFIDASIAYQGVGRGIGVETVKQLANILEPKLIT